VNWRFLNALAVLMAPEENPAGAAGGAPSTPAGQSAPATAPSTPAANPAADALAGIRQRREAREAARQAATAPKTQLPPDIADKVKRFEAFEAKEKAAQDTEAKTLTPQARAVFDTIGDLQARRAFLDFNKTAAQAPANAPPGAGSAGGGSPPATGVVDVPKLIAERGTEWVKANHAEAYQKYADGFRVQEKQTSMKSAYLKAPTKK
jgi:hypothetical protein